MEKLKAAIIWIIWMAIVRPVFFMAGIIFAFTTIIIGRFDIAQDWVADYEFKKTLKDEDDRHDRFEKYYGR